MNAHSGFAFPNLELDAISGQVVDQHFGLTVRDYFASHAPSIPSDFEYIDEELSYWKRRVRWNYAYADAMIAERQK